MPNIHPYRDAVEKTVYTPPAHPINGFRRFTNETTRLRLVEVVNTPSGQVAVFTKSRKRNRIRIQSVANVNHIVLWEPDKCRVTKLEPGSFVHGVLNLYKAGTPQSYKHLITD